MKTTQVVKVGMENERELFEVYMRAYNAMCDLATILGRIEGEGKKVRGDMEDESDVLLPAARRLIVYDNE